MNHSNTPQSWHSGPHISIFPAGHLAIWLPFQLFGKSSLSWWNRAASYVESHSDAPFWSYVQKQSFTVIPQQAVMRWHRFQLPRIIRGSHGNWHQKPAMYGIAHRSIEIRNSPDQSGGVSRGCSSTPYAAKTIEASTQKLTTLVALACPANCEVITSGAGFVNNKHASIANSNLRSTTAVVLKFQS
jgi:hypothetical protein